MVCVDVCGGRREPNMSQSTAIQKPVFNWLTVVSIAAIAISFTVGFHEGVHALTCLTVGGQLLEYSALYESCDSSTVFQAKMVAGSAPTFNLLAGIALWLILRRTKKLSPNIWLFIWLFMLMNWCYGAGYFIFSGIANIGDWAVVINGWEPSWMWRTLMVLIGIMLYILFVRLALNEIGKVIGGKSDDHFQQANRLFILSYLTSFAVVLSAGFFCPYGFFSLPVTAGLAAVLGALSPLLWMVRWFRTDSITKLEKEPLTIDHNWIWPGAAVFVVFMYVFILGRTFYF
jgi:hypothetical protein